MPSKSHASGSEKFTSTMEQATLGMCVQNNELGTEACVGHCLDHIVVCRNNQEIHPRSVNNQTARQSAVSVL